MKTLPVLAAALLLTGCLRTPPPDLSPAEAKAAIQELRQTGRMAWVFLAGFYVGALGVLFILKPAKQHKQ